VLKKLFAGKTTIIFIFKKTCYLFDFTWIHE
jgi:hypothetical protein